MKKKTEKVEYFDTKKYACRITGIGAGRWHQKSESRPVDQVKGYLKREKNRLMNKNGPASLLRTGPKNEKPKTLFFVEQVPNDVSNIYQHSEQ